MYYTVRTLVMLAYSRPAMHFLGQDCYHGCSHGCFNEQAISALA